jgi:ABC-type polysaccharide transport system, permease component
MGKHNLPMILCHGKEGMSAPLKQNISNTNRMAVKNHSFLKELNYQKYLFIMLLPGVIWLIVMCYGPLYGIIIAFKDYNPGKGILASPWVGLKYFNELFNDPFFGNALRNTLVISVLKLAVGFPAPIVFALMLSELKSIAFKRTVQTISYMPYFLSWAFVASFLITFFSDGGFINKIILQLGLTNEPVSFLGQELPFVLVILLSDVWKNFGYGSIIYLAVIVSIDPQLYEAAIMDGATRWKRIWHITLPSIKPTVAILLILSISGIINANFEQFYLLQNQLVMDWARVLNVYTYEVGLQKGRFSYGTAVGLFTSLSSMLLLIIANASSRKLTGESIY